MAKPTLVSLYSGCGGSSWGFKKAGFSVKYMNDNNPDAIESLKLNFPGAIIEKGDVKKRNGIAVLWEQLKDVDVIEGGFPCQGFSLAGPRKMGDVRNDLYHYLKRAIAYGRPKFFVAENVKGFVSLGETGKFQMYKNGELQLGETADAIVKDLSIDGGYKVYYDVLNAKHFGIPQDRERIFIVGVRKNVKFTFKFPKATHGKPGLRETVKLGDEKYGIKHIRSRKSERCDDYFSSRYMSRNRIKKWNEISFTIPAEAAQVPLHPSCTRMWNLPASVISEVKDSKWNEFRSEHEDDMYDKMKRLFSLEIRNDARCNLLH